MLGKIGEQPSRRPRKPPDEAKHQHKHAIGTLARPTLATQHHALYAAPRRDADPPPGARPPRTSRTTVR